MFKHSQDYIPAFFAEIVGSAILMYFGCMGCTKEKEIGVVVPAFSFGMAVATAVQVLVTISQAHFNPAVTVGVLILGKSNWIKSILYLIAQVIGTMIGYSLLYFQLSDNLKKDLCVLTVNPEISPEQAFYIEMCGTMVLVMVVGAIVDDRHVSTDDSVPLKVGFIITGLVFAMGPLTGCGINPARSFPPALLNKNFKDYWVYVAGPFAGGIVGSLIYRFFFSSSEAYSVPVMINKCLGRIDDDGNENI